MRRVVLLIVFLVASVFLRLAHAGPPFLTDDPVPTDYKHFEVILFSQTEKNKDATNIQFPALEVDYGLIPNLEINLTTSIITNISDTDDPNSAGLGDIQLGATWRFLQESQYIPQVAFAPAYFLPTGDCNRKLGNGRPYLSLPFWAQKSWGPWTTYGGVGYTINNEPDMLNYFFGGWLIQKDLNEHWTLGGEIFSQGATDDTAQATTIINVGGAYNVSKILSIIFSAGHSVIGADNFVAFVGLDWTL